MQLLLLSCIVTFAFADLTSDCRTKTKGDCTEFYTCCFGGGAMGAGCCPGAFTDPQKTYCSGGPEPQPEQDDATFQKEILDSHNAYRAQHGAPPMKIDADAEALATGYAKKLADAGELKHNPDANGFGENLYAGSAPVTGKAAVDSWYSEISEYDFEKPGFSMETGHFTQVVWKESTGLGCGRAASKALGMTIVVCNYKPPGNGGDFTANVGRKARR